MRLINATLVGLSLALAAPAAPALAQAAPRVGMQVTDASGGVVGSVRAIQGSNLLIQTDKHQALLPSSSFTVSNGKLLFGMTQAQLDAEIEKGLAAAQASIAPGASVSETAVIIALPSGKKVQIAKSGVRGNTDGSVTVGVTAEQLNAQVQGSDSAAPQDAAAKPSTPQAQ